MRFIPWGRPVEGEAAHVPDADRLVPPGELIIYVHDHPTIREVLVEVEPFDMRVGEPVHGVVVGLERRMVER